MLSETTEMNSVISIEMSIGRAGREKIEEIPKSDQIDCGSTGIIL